jgi:hypothetical protein
MSAYLMFMKLYETPIENGLRAATLFLLLITIVYYIINCLG